METLIANSALYNKTEYGQVYPGQAFKAREDIARELLLSGKARRSTYETHAIVPVEVQKLSAEPFRHVPAVDAKQTAVAAEGDRVLPASDLPAKGTAGAVKRAGRGAPASRR